MLRTLRGYNAHFLDACLGLRNEASKLASPWHVPIRAFIVVAVVVRRIKRISTDNAIIDALWANFRHF